MTVSGSHQPVRASFRPRLTTTPWRFGDSEVIVKQPPPGHLFGSPVSAFGYPETGFGEVAGAAKTIHAGWKWLSLALIRATSRPMVRTDTPNIAAHSA